MIFSWISSLSFRAVIWHSWEHSNASFIDCILNEESFIFWYLSRDQWYKIMSNYHQPLFVGFRLEVERLKGSINLDQEASGGTALIKDGFGRCLAVDAPQVTHDSIPVHFNSFGLCGQTSFQAQSLPQKMQHEECRSECMKDRNCIGFSTTLL